VNTRYAAIILAGGLSTRMKQFKPLLPLGKTNISDHVIASFLTAGADVLLVAGYRYDEIKAGIKKRGVTVVYNPNYEQGMFSSIQAGVKRLKPFYQAFFINPVDIPLVRPATIKRLMDAAEENPDRIIYPVFGGKRGHPPLIPCGLAPAILGWGKGGGLKAVLDSQEKLALEITVPDSTILFDIDTPEDYAALLKRYQRYEVPTDEECDMILKGICKVAPDRIHHCLKVADVAVAIGKALNATDHKVDIELVRIAAKLHDIAKGQKKHDIAGGKTLRELGFGKVGDIVAVHSDLAGGDLSLSLEAKVVYLADKFVLGEILVSLEERYSSANRRLGLTPKIVDAITQRLKVAQQVKRELESLLGRPLESVVFGKS
jgi:CTP:molybdopterin cytidylyltransferase MocA